jgi:hypothetical protein
MLRKITCAGILSIAPLLFGQAAAEDVFGPPPPPPPPTLPVLYCAEPIFDWGELIEGDSAEHTYEIENKGGAPLLIENVKTTCGCTSSKFDKEIAPGAKGVVVLQLRTRGYGGSNVKKTATIVCNDPVNKQFGLTIGGAVKSVLKFDPERPALEGLRGQTLTTKVKLLCNIASDIKIISVKGQPASRVTTELVETKPGREWELALSLDTKDKPATVSAYDRLTIMVQIGDKTVETGVSLRIKLVDTITALPTYITFRAYELQAFTKNPATLKPSRTVVLKSWQNKPFKVTSLELKARRFSATPNDKGQEIPAPVAATLEGDSATGECKVKIDAIKFEDEESMGRPVRSELTIKTDDPGTPEILIPVTVYFPSKDQPVVGAPSGSAPKAAPAPFTLKPPPAGMQPPVAAPAPSAPPTTGVAKAPAYDTHPSPRQVPSPNSAPNPVPAPAAK